MPISLTGVAAYGLGTPQAHNLQPRLCRVMENAGPDGGEEQGG
ncbi:hypothetical protein [Corynebacterium belfantii]|nr:hypothetical protein [Corynebacterium belfantii]